MRKYERRCFYEKENRSIAAGSCAHIIIIEKRFAEMLGLNQNQMLSVVLTHDEHKVFTKAWQDAIPHMGKYDGVINANDIWRAAQDIYADYPELLEAARITIFGS